MTTVKPNMIVKILLGNSLLNRGCLGRVISCNPDSGRPIVIMWQTGNPSTQYSKDLEILTPPINMNMFSNYSEVTSFPDSELIF